MLLLYTHNSYGDWFKYEYDQQGNILKEENYKGICVKYKYYYDKKHKIIKQDYSDGSFIINKYDERNNNIKSIYPSYFINRVFDKNNNMVKEQ